MIIHVFVNTDSISTRKINFVKVSDISGVVRKQLSKANVKVKRNRKEKNINIPKCFIVRLVDHAFLPRLLIGWNMACTRVLPLK